MWVAQEGFDSIKTKKTNSDGVEIGLVKSI
jgi:hypothetical protein